MKNKDNENFDGEDRSFYSEGQRPGRNNSKEKEPLNIDKIQNNAENYMEGLHKMKKLRKKAM
jgi:hypothetical protein